MTGRGRLVLAKARICSPVQSGTDAVSFATVASLADRFDVTLLAADEGPRSTVGATELRRLGVDVRLVAPHRSRGERVPLLGKVALNLDRLVRGVPRAHHVDAWPALAAGLREATAGGSAALTVLEYWTLGRYRDHVDGPAALLHHDVWHRTAEQIAGASPSRRRRWVWGLEAAATRRFEREAGRGFDWLLYLTDADRELASRNQASEVGRDGLAGRRRTVPVVFPFEPVERAPPFPRSSSDPPTAVFVGGMKALFNAEAAVHMATEIWPEVRARVADARLRIVGGDPPAALLEAQEHGVEVTGFVPDPADAFRGCSVSVAPMRIGTGIKVKIALAMSQGVPVVAYSNALAGYDRAPGTVPANDPSTFAEALVRLLQRGPSRDTLAQAALEHYRSALWWRSQRGAVCDFYSGLGHGG